MLRSFSLSGFKAFSNEQTLPLAPITLIYGPNSAGKSSIIQSLLLLKQSLLPNLNRSSFPVFRGDLADLGSFVSAVHKHNPKTKIRLAVEFDSGNWLRDIHVEGPRSRGALDKLSLVFSSSKKASATDRHDSSTLESISDSFVSEIRYRFLPKPNSSDGAASEVALKFIQVDAGGTGHYQFSNKRSTRNYLDALMSSDSFFSDRLAYELQRMKAQLDALLAKQASLSARVASSKNRSDPVVDKPHSGISSSDIESRALQGRIEEMKQEIAALEKRRLSPSEWEKVLTAVKFKSPGILPLYVDFSEAAYDDRVGRIDFSRPIERAARMVQRLFELLVYLGPLRAPPERHYVFTTMDGQSVGKSGENTPAIVYAKGRELIDAVNRWFSKFDIGYDLRPKSLGNEVVGRLFSLNLVDRETKVEIGSSDVGFGLGQLTPILVEGLSSTGKTILVEQPEIHLHPRLQGHLADFLIHTSEIRTARRPERQRQVGFEVGSANQWIIETHSEALITRLQRRIREGTLSKDKLSVLYVQPDSEVGATIRRLRLSEEGDFMDEWPSGFFEDRLNDILA